MAGRKTRKGKGKDKEKIKTISRTSEELKLMDLFSTLAFELFFIRHVLCYTRVRSYARVYNTDGIKLIWSNFQCLIVLPTLVFTA